MHPDVDRFLRAAPAWREEMGALRAISIDSGLDEVIKWAKPCYCVDGGNVAIIQPFKNACGFMFFKGALLDDPGELLEPPGPNSRAARRLMFTSVAEIREVEPTLRGFLARAIEIERSGAGVPTEDDREELPVELEERLERTPGLREAFENLTPGRQRGYVLHVAGAKQEATRRSRVEKCIPRILEGKGVHDR